MPLHFDLLAPFYDRLLPPPDPEVWMEFLCLPAGRLLDAGGGTGRVSAELLRMVGTAVVCDLSHRMLLRAGAKGGLNPVRGDAARLPFADAVFDRALVVDAFHHFPRQKEALREILRVLVPGGRLVIKEPDIRTLPVKGVALAEKALLMRSRFISPVEICRLARDLGAEATLRKGEWFSAWIVIDRR